MEIKEIRLAVMGSLIHDRFDNTARKFALAVKRPERQINDMQRGRKAFGEKVARAFEKELCLPPCYFDQIKNIAPDRIENFSAANAARGPGYEIDPIAMVSSIMRSLDDEKGVPSCSAWPNTSSINLTTRTRIYPSTTATNDSRRCA